MEYIQITFESLEADKQEMLIALLVEAGFTGFEEEETRLKAFINKDNFDRSLFENIISTFGINYSESLIYETNWNQEWESGFDPVTIFYPGTDRPFVHVRAAFHEKNNSVDFDIEVTPKMSFGTGHHDTTYGMIEQMSKLDFRNKQVVDFGTGTGVLAILAEKMGAAFVLAIDNDEWSINNATENFIKNDCTKIMLSQAETIPAEHKASILLANINLNIIIACLDDIRNACMPDALILFSGIMVKDKATILDELIRKNFIISDCITRHEWLIISAKVG